MEDVIEKIKRDGQNTLINIVSWFQDNESEELENNEEEIQEESPEIQKRPLSDLPFDVKHGLESTFSKTIEEKLTENKVAEFQQPSKSTESLVHWMKESASKNLTKVIESNTEKIKKFAKKDTFVTVFEDKLVRKDSKKIFKEEYPNSAMIEEKLQMAVKNVIEDIKILEQSMVDIKTTINNEQTAIQNKGDLKKNKEDRKQKLEEDLAKEFKEISFDSRIRDSIEDISTNIFGNSSYIDEKFNELKEQGYLSFNSIMRWMTGGKTLECSEDIKKEIVEETPCLIINDANNTTDGASENNDDNVQENSLEAKFDELRQKGKTSVDELLKWMKDCTGRD